MAVLSPVAKQQFFTDAGTPAAGYKLYTYAANTTTPQATYSNRDGSSPNTNPVVLDSRGEAVIYLDPTLVYDYVLKTASDVTIWTREDVVSAGSNAADIGFTQSGAGAFPRTVQKRGEDFAHAFDFIDPQFHAAILAGTSDHDAAPDIQNGLDSHGFIDMPEGLFTFATALKLKKQGAILRGVGRTNYPLVGTVYGGSKILWRGTSGNVIEFNSRRRDTPSSVTAITGASLSNLAVFLALGSTCDNILWIEQGTYHSHAKELSLLNYYGGTVNNAAIKLESGNGASYPLGVTLDDIVVRNDYAGATSPIPKGLHIQSAIESKFKRVAIYDCNEGFVFGDSDATKYSNVQNIDLFGCIAEIGNRYACTSTGSSSTFYAGDNINLYGTKLASAATSSGAPWNDHRSVRFKSDSASNLCRGVNFYGCQLWGFSQADYAIEADDGATPRDILFDASTILQFKKGTIKSNGAATPQIKFRDAKIRQSRFDGDPETAFAAMGYKAGALAPGASSAVKVNATEMTLNKSVLYAMASMTDNNGQPILISPVQINFPNFGVELNYYNAGSAATIPATSITRVRPLQNSEILSQVKAPYVSALIGNSVVYAQTVMLPGAKMGDHLFVTYAPTATGTFVLDRLQLCAHVTADGQASVKIMNKGRAAAITLPAGSFYVARALPKFDIYQVSNLDIPSINNVTEYTQDVTVTGAAVGDFVSVAPSASLSGLFCKATVKAADTVTLYFYNQTGAAVDLAAMDFNIGIVKQPALA